MLKFSLLFISLVALLACDGNKLPRGPRVGVPGPGGLFPGGPPLLTPGGTDLEEWEPFSHESTVRLSVGAEPMRRFLARTERGRQKGSTYINISLGQRGVIDSCHDGWVHNQYLYGGTVTIGFKAKKGNYPTGEFHSDQTSRYSVAGKGDSGHDGSNRYNYIFLNPKLADNADATPRIVWQGFFEDDKGAIIVIIDKTQGEDGSFTRVGGQVWFKNFAYSRTSGRGPPPPTPCWFISAGPYDCRAFVKHGEEHITSPGLRALSDYRKHYAPIYPSPWQYKLLGDFNNLNVRAAFGLDNPFEGDACAHARRRTGMKKGSAASEKARKIASVPKKPGKKVKVKPFKLPKNRTPLR